MQKIYCTKPQQAGQQRGNKLNVCVGWSYGWTPLMPSEALITEKPLLQKHVWSFSKDLTGPQIPVVVVLKPIPRTSPLFIPDKSSISSNFLLFTYLQTCSCSSSSLRSAQTGLFTPMTISEPLERELPLQNSGTLPTDACPYHRQWNVITSAQNCWIS